MPETMTVGELKENLESWPNDWNIEFAGHTFYRLKQRGSQLVDMEFNETCRILDI